MPPSSKKTAPGDWAESKSKVQTNPPTKPQSKAPVPALPAARRAADCHLKVGIGGWNFKPWRDNFYPPKWPQARELEYASRQVSAIEINSTYYGAQKPASFAKWRDQTPDDFVFAVKASRYATNRRVLAEAGESIERFLHGGLLELGDKLGPVLWQLAPTKQFDHEDLRAFLGLLPHTLEGRRLRHVLDVRHESFMCVEFLALARQFGVATVFTDSPKFPSFADSTADFTYARLMASQARLKQGYAPKALDQWAEMARLWGNNQIPEGLPLIEVKAGHSNHQAPTSKPVKAGAGKSAATPREVFLFFINGAKERAPAAACAVLDRLAQ